MAKILISPLGAGRPSGTNENSIREYRTAKYRLDGREYEDSFVASALYKHLGLDDIIFIGTVKSIWEEVYRFFYEDRNKKHLDGEELDYYFHLATQVEQLNSNSELDELDLSPIEKLLGDRSQCILIKYGLNEAELSENFDRIIQVANSLRSGDEIYIDISNSFRSLSLFLFLVLSFIKDSAEEKGVKISGVYYGMLDVIGELKYAPLVDLKSFFEVTDWIKAGYSLQTYGDSSLIAKLLEQQNQSQLASSFANFSQAVNIGYLPNIRQQIKSLQVNLNKSKITGAFKYLQSSISKFLKPFDREHESEFQLELVKWYFDHQRYATGYITMTEAILTYLCEIENKNPDREADRNYVKDLAFKRPYQNYPLAKLYKEINEIRKNIAHLSMAMNSRETELLGDVKKALDYQQKLKTIFRSGTWGEDLFRIRQ